MMGAYHAKDREAPWICYSNDMLVMTRHVHVCTSAWAASKWVVAYDDCGCLDAIV